MKGILNRELFELIEKRGSVTVDDVAKKFGLKRRSAASLLSKWTNYFDRDRGCHRHYLVHGKGKGRSPGRYRIGPDWWGERLFQSAKPPWDKIVYIGESKVSGKEKSIRRDGR